MMVRIEKACKHCQAQFFVEYEKNGTGSGHVAKSQYCSPECKKKWYKIPHNGKKEEIVCKICGKKFYLPASQAKNRVTCSKACYGRHMSSVNKKYDVINKSCLICEEFFTVSENSQQKYCSPKCFSVSITNKKEFVCEICKKSLQVKQSSANRFCSRVCSRKAQSLGLIKAHTHGRSGWRLDIVDSPYFKSSLEADYARYCNYSNIKYEYEKRVFEVKISPGSVRFYTPDFYLPETDEFVELKGVRLGVNSFSKKINSNSQAREALQSQGVRIKVIYMDDFYSSLKEQQLYDKIPNLENRNYGNTVRFIKTHKDSTDRSDRTP